MVLTFRKILELELMQEYNDTSSMMKNEIFNEISMQSNFKNWKINIERSSNLHLDFWSNLCEDTPG